MRPKIDHKKPQEKQTKSSDNIDRAPKRSPRGFLGSQEFPKRPPRAPQRSPGGSQDTPKSVQKRATRTRRRSQDHLRIEDVDFPKIELRLKRGLDF